MSSMTRAALFLPLMFAATAGSAAQMPIASPYYAPVRSSAIDNALLSWKRLRQSDSYSFASYASFLASYPGWPGEASLRRSAEKAMRPGEMPGSVIAFFRKDEPTSGNGWARLAEAQASSGRQAEAIVAARNAWGSGDLNPLDEASLFARFGSQLTTADHDRRADALLFAKKPGEAQRLLGSVSPGRRGAFAARIALQSRAPDAETLYAAAAGQLSGDAGLLMDRARYLRDANNEPAARQLFARPHSFTVRPADAKRMLEMMVILSRGAAADRQWQSAYDIARQLDDSFAPGAVISDQSYGVRDDYTTLAWLAGTTAMRIGRPVEAMALFDKYSRGGKSLQVASKGNYWAGRAAMQAGRIADANRYFERAAATPELFYSQLALERLGRPVPAPAGMPNLMVTAAERAAFQQKPLVRAIRQLGSQGNRSDQSLFIRALSEAVNGNSERVLASELANAIGRQDLAVWTARSARNNGSAFYYRSAFPTHSMSGAQGRLWSVVHGITRQESSFDRGAVSHAGARGMMQLMLPTAREQAGKMGLAYDSGQLTSNPSYNVMLGTAYFQRLLDNWGGSYPLAVASYNAGSGNVRKWVNAYGDPRTPGVDMVNWIEQIPFEETRGYVQRVLENSVVYDRLNPGMTAPSRVHLSTYLGKSARPG